MKWVDVADTQDIEKGKMGLVEVERNKVVIANVEGKFYAFNDRCPHSNAPLHLGRLQGKVIRCAAHFSSFDVTTGKKLSDPKELSISPEIMQNMPLIFFKWPERWLKSRGRSRQSTLKRTKLKLRTIEY